MKYKKIITSLYESNSDLLVDLTEKSTKYISDCVLERDNSNTKSNLVRALEKLEGEKPLNVDDFSIELVNCLFERRS